jgi:hypothetical protein
MALPLDRVKVFSSTTGTGASVALGAIVSNLFASPSEAGMVNGATYMYVIEQGTSWEINQGAYSTTGPTIARGTPIASRVGGTYGTTKITLDGTQVVYFPLFPSLLLPKDGSVAMTGRLELPSAQSAYVDKGNSGSGTVTFDVSAARVQRVKATGNFTLAFSGWPASGKFGEVFIGYVADGTLRAPNFSAVRWYNGDGTYSTTFSNMGVTLQSANDATNWLTCWSIDGGTVVHGRAM